MANLIIIALDGVDGCVAHNRGEISLFGSIFDIAADRMVESVLWLVLANQDLVPVWVTILFLTRVVPVIFDVIPLGGPGGRIRLLGG